MKSLNAYAAEGDDPVAPLVGVWIEIVYPPTGDLGSFGGSDRQIGGGRSGEWGEV